ncbi:Protein PHLOEM PROTEIN 2-LIKE A1 [Linum perenne]
MGTSWSQDEEAAAKAASASQLQPTQQPVHGQGQLQRQYSAQKQSEEKQNHKQSGTKSNTSDRVPAAAVSHQPSIHGQDQLQRQYSAQKHSEARQSGVKPNDTFRASATASPLHPTHQPSINGQGQLQRQYSAQKKNEGKQSPQQITQVKLPHNWEAILRDADTPIDRSSPEKLYNQLSQAKYWVDKNSNSNCFTLFARDLLITWADDPRYWHWPCVAETRDVRVEAAEVLAVCWLEVHGNFDTAKLSPVTLYEVVYEIMLKDTAVGWEVPVNFRLTLPNGVKQEHKENMMTKPRMQWVEIPVGEFRTSSDKNNGGMMEISMYEYEGGTWKKGIIVKGVTIRPKNSTIQAIGTV